MTRDLLIILRTCTTVNMLSGNNRYINIPKHELVNVCTSSLVNSINQVQDHNIRLIVLDDHSTPEGVADIERILAKSKVPTEFISVKDGSGNSHTMSEVYKLVEDQCTDLWYHVEDDYLHQPEAIQDMLDTVDLFEKATGKMVAVNPHDDIWRYKHEIYESYILLGPYKHYRTVKHTTFTCLASKAIYTKYRNHFQDVVTLTSQRADWVENKSINLVWNKPDVMLFSPIPGLGFHIMDESGMDPYLDVVAVWDSVPRLWQNSEKPSIAIVSAFNDKHKELADEILENMLAKKDSKFWKEFSTSSFKDNWWTPEMIFVTNFLRNYKDRKIAHHICNLLFKRYITRNEKEFSRHFYLNDKQIKEMVERGHLIGGHGYYSENLVNLPKDEQKIDIEKSIDFVKKYNSDVYFSYPNGGFNDDVIKTLRNLNCKVAFTTESTSTNLDYDLLRFPRISAPEKLIR